MIKLSYSWFLYKVVIVSNALCTAWFSFLVNVLIFDFNSRFYFAVASLISMGISDYERYS